MAASVQLSTHLPSLSLGSACLPQQNILAADSLKQALAIDKSTHHSFKASPSSTLNTCITAFDVEIQTYEQKIKELEGKKAKVNADYFKKDGPLRQEYEKLLADMDQHDEINAGFKQKMDNYPRQIAHITQSILQLQAANAPLLLELSSAIHLFEQNFNHLRINFSAAQNQIELKQNAQKSIAMATQGIEGISSGQNIFDKLNQLKEKLVVIEKEIQSLELKKVELAQALPIVEEDYQNFILSIEHESARIGQLTKERNNDQAVYQSQCEIIDQELRQFSCKLETAKAHKKNLQAVIALSEASAKAAQTSFLAQQSCQSHRLQSQSVPPSLLSFHSPSEASRPHTCPPLAGSKHLVEKELSEFDERKKSRLEGSSKNN
jgi:hypothetical protein